METVMVPQPVARLFGLLGFCSDSEWELVRSLVLGRKARKGAERLLQSLLGKLGLIDDDDEPTPDGTQVVRFLGQWPDWQDSDDAQFILPDGQNVQDAWPDAEWAG